MEFESAFSKKLYNLMQIIDVTSPAISPQTNAHIESVWKTVKNYMKCFLEKQSHVDWVSHLPAMQLAYNSALHSRLLAPPLSIHFARQANDSWLQSGNTKPLYCADDFAVSHYNEAMRARQVASECLEKAQTDSKNYFDKKTLHLQFEQGEKIYVFYPNLQTNGEINTGKFMRHWFEGTVLEQVGEQTYRIQFLGSSREFIAHARRLKSANKQLQSTFVLGKEVDKESQPVLVPDSEEEPVVLRRSERIKRQNE